MLDIQIKETPLSAHEYYEWVQDDACGGVAIFVGTVRDQTGGRKVQYLDFEAYVPMALSEMRKIGDQAVQKWAVRKMGIYHRVGQLKVGEVAVIIAVATPHRKAAFEACEYAINTLKERVPIWKKEVFEDGEIWVSAYP